MRLILLLSFTIFHNALCRNVRVDNVRVDPLVHIDQGLVRGEKSNNGEYSIFLGIPYAQIDLDNPFGSAQPAPHFPEIFNAYDGSVKCPQILKGGSYEGTLDCLRLNIYVPSQASSRNPLPVLIWIHGGGFSAGASGDFHPRNLVTQGIVVVTINYRLGAYGFMCLDHPSVPGNQGLKDQYEAIRWIRRNIAAFGGNPYEMTLGGESAGSACVLYHLYSSKERFYNKIIVQSDTPQNENMFTEKDSEVAIKIAGHLGLITTDTEQALEFLNEASPDLVVAAAQALNLKTRPCKENDFDGVDSFVAADPFSLSNSKKIRDTPILIGHTTKEHMGVLLEIYGDDYLKRDPFYEKISDNFDLSEEELFKAADFVRHFYVGDDALTKELIPALEDFDSDFVFVHSVQRTITNLFKENPKAVYEYLFSYNGGSETIGVGHASENKFLFENPDVNEGDQLMVNRMTTLWSNFVKYGNPTPTETELLPVTWEPISLDSRPYMVLDTDMRLEHRVFKDRMAFWDLFYEAYGRYNRFTEGSNDRGFVNKRGNFDGSSMFRASFDPSLLSGASMSEKLPS